MPQSVTSLLQKTGLDGPAVESVPGDGDTVRVVVTPAMPPTLIPAPLGDGDGGVTAPAAAAIANTTPVPRDAPIEAPQADAAQSPKARSSRRTPSAKKRPAAAETKLPAGVKPLAVKDAISGSTYLARIVWALGVSSREGSGPLRPADIARMVMARSPISLEPPNIARYIRRSNPACLAVEKTEGSSSYYRLNAAGKRLFSEHFTE